MPYSNASSRLRADNGSFAKTSQSPLTAHYSPTANEPVTDHTPKDTNQLMMKNLWKINKGIDSLAYASPAANQPEETQQSSMVIRQQTRISEQKPVDIINQRLANYLRANTSDAAFSQYDNKSGKKSSKTTRLAPKDDDAQPPYDEDFRIPILYDTIASLEFQISKLIQTNRLLRIRNSRNLSTFITSKRAAEENLQEQADVKFRGIQEKHHQQLLSLGLGVDVDPASSSASTSTSISTSTSTSSMDSTTAVIEATRKMLLANKTELETLQRDNSLLVAKRAEELNIMQNKIDKWKMEMEKSEANVTALVSALVGLAAMWLLGLILWWDI